jgi:hypothetical protein
MWTFDTNLVLVVRLRLGLERVEWPDGNFFVTGYIKYDHEIANTQITVA